MFKKNSKHIQRDIFGMQNTMPEELKKRAVKSEEYNFYHIIFCNIKEKIFSVLYSNKKSRPNAPINSMVAALLLQNRRKTILILKESKENCKMIKKRILFAVFIFLSIYHFGVNVHPQTIADITNDVETDFGTYHPYLVTITPAASTYSVNSDFDNVSNFQDLSAIFSEADLNFLRNNYFAVKPTEYKEIFDVYKDCKEREIPIFVTTDAMLHTFHIIYDYALRALEVQKFAQDLDALNKAMLDATEQLYHSTTNDSLKDIIKKSVAYFGVATKLKDECATVPAFVENLVQAEIDLITVHEGFANSPIFNDDSIEYIEDYSKYIPRWH